MNVRAKTQRHRVAALEKHSQHHDGVAAIDADFENRERRAAGSSNEHADDGEQDPDTLQTGDAHAEETDNWRRLSARAWRIARW